VQKRDIWITGIKNSKTKNLKKVTITN
jgi:hypothetical protein